MQAAFETINGLLNEGEVLTKKSLETARGCVRTANGHSANYATLCERVNALGTAIAKIKSDYSSLLQEKKEILKILGKLETTNPQERQRLATILQNA